MKRFHSRKKRTWRSWPSTLQLALGNTLEICQKKTQTINLLKKKDWRQIKLLNWQRREMPQPSNVARLTSKTCNSRLKSADTITKKTLRLTTTLKMANNMSNMWSQVIQLFWLNNWRLLIKRLHSHKHHITHLKRMQKPENITTTSSNEYARRSKRSSINRVIRSRHIQQSQPIWWNNYQKQLLCKKNQMFDKSQLVHTKRDSKSPLMTLMEKVHHSKSQKNNQHQLNKLNYLPNPPKKIK